MATLSFFMVGQVLFTLAEGCRQMELRHVAVMTSDCAAEAMMADYCRPMWDQYRLLAYDAGAPDGNISTLQISRYMEGLIAGDFALDEGREPGGTSLLRLAPGEITFDSYTLLTDGEGYAYGKTIASYMQQNLLMEEAKRIYGDYESMNTLVSGSAFDFSSIQDALHIIGGKTNPTPAPVSNSGGEQMGSEEGASVDCPILRDVDEISARGILKLVLPDNGKVSSKGIRLDNVVSHRKLEQGVAPEKGSLGWYETVLVQQYLLHYLNSYCTKREETALAYELEYLICGKSRDEDNLKGAVERVLAMREAVNFLFLESNPARKAQVEALAETMGLVTANPVVYEGVKLGLLAAWAYVESVMDVRTLLTGGKIAPIKSDKTWTSSLQNLVPLLKGKACAISTDIGLDYEDYLGLILFALPGKSMTGRAMDVQEAAIRGMEYYSDFRMDHSLCCMKATISYRNEPIFLSFVDILQANRELPDITVRTGYSYWDRAIK